MNIYNLHTHSHPESEGTAIVQLYPDKFEPLPQHNYSIGLHPWYITDDWRTQLAKMAIMALHPQVLAIGEAGLDKVKCFTPMDTQLDVLREHIRLSEIVHKPMIIHCVKAVDELLNVRNEMGAKQPWLFHGFRGGVEQAEQLRKKNIHISLGRHYNPDLVRHLPLDALFLESDTDKDIEAIYASISEYLLIEPEGLKKIVSSNTLRFLSSPF